MPELAAIPGVSALWALTLGDPRIRVAVIDGPSDARHPCFDGAAIEVVATGWSPPGHEHDGRLEHGTWVTGVLVGQHGSPSPGLAPRCTALVVPGIRYEVDESDPLNTARCIEAAIGAGAHVVVLEQALPSRSGDVDGLLKSVVRGAEESGVLLVLPAGNDGTKHHSFPQALPEVLVVGAHDDDGAMFKFSASGFGYAGHGIVAPGGNITGPKYSGGVVTHKGTSCSSAIVGGIAGLLLSLQVQAGEDPDPLAIREILLETARPCTVREAHGELERCLGGKLDVAAATRRVLGRDGSLVPRLGGVRPGAARPSGSAGAGGAAHALGTAGVVPADGAGAPASREATGPLVYALGSLHYDFGSAARRDRFKQTMEGVPVDRSVVPANPSDAQQVVDHLTRRPLDANGLIWTLNVELTPIYAIAPSGPQAPAIFELLVTMLAGELAGESLLREVGRVTIAGRLTGRNVELFSGQVVPVIELAQPRGVSSWGVVALALATTRAQAARGGGDGVAGRALRELLTRVYYELRNLGLTAPDRALNFAVSAAVAAALPLAEVLVDGLALDTMAARRSERCRPGSDCWDVTLRFFDPQDLRRARRVSRAAVDVADVIPVMLGAVRTWSESAPREAPTAVTRHP